MNPFNSTFYRRTGRRLAAAALPAVLLSSCITFHKDDLLRFADRPVALGGVPLSSDQTIRTLDVSAGGRQVLTYLVETQNARGVLIAIGGNGNQVQPLLKELAPRARALGLDLIAYSYYVHGESAPSVEQAHEAAEAVYAAAGKLETPASKSVYLLGHSYGCWLAADVAAHEPAKGLILAAAGTNIAETFGNEYFPLNQIVRFGADEEVSKIDAVRDAKSVRAPTIIFSSNSDGVIRAPLTRRVFDALPDETRKSFVIFKHVGHLGYFSQDRFWDDIGEFLDLNPVKPAAAGAS